MTIQLIFPCFASPFTPSSLSTTKVGLSDAHCRKTVEGTYIDILTSVRTQDDTPNVIERQLSETKRLSHGCTLSIPTTSTTVCESGKCVCELTVSANVCVWEKERWSQTEPCKFPLAITLRRVMLRSTQSASQKILTHSFYEWDSMYARYTHRVKIVYNDVIQSHRAAEALVTNAVWAESEHFDTFHFVFLNALI